MDERERILNALDCLEVIAREAGNFLKNPSDANRDWLTEALAKYDNGDAWDLVNEELYEGSERII